MSKKSFLGGVVLGSLIGGIVALLFAPESGKKTRAWVKNKVDEKQDTLEDVKHFVVETKNKLENNAVKLKKMMEEKATQFMNECKNKKKNNGDLS